MEMTDRNIKSPEKVKPKYIPVKCAVCNGFGSVNWGKAECHACKGKGYILVPPQETGEEHGETTR